jgi:hypothetical protein
MATHITKVRGGKKTCYIIKKSILKPKEELWKLKYFTIAKIYLIFKKKNPLKENQNPSRYYYYNSIITNSQVSTQAKISSFKNHHIKINRPIIIIIIIIIT